MTVDTRKPADHSLEKAREFLSRGKFQEAGEIYHALLGLDAQNVKAIVGCGVVQFQRSKFEEAYKFFEKALQLAPNEPENYRNLASSQVNLGKLDDAVRNYTVAIKLNPQNADYYYNRALAFIKLDDLSAAESDLKKTLEIYPGYPPAHSGLCALYKKKKKWHEALLFAEKLTENTKHVIDGYIQAGNCHLELKNFSKAEQCFHHALNFDAQSFKALEGLGKSLLRQRRHPEAILLWEKAVRDGIKNEGMLCNIGFAHFELGDMQKALRYFDQALSINPEHIGSKWNKALCLLMIRNYKEGWALYEYGWMTQSRGKPRKYSKPLWIGSGSIAGKRLFISSEQGFGDHINFSRFVEPLARLGARVFLEVPKDLLELFSCLEHVEVFVQKGNPVPEYDFYCPLMSLPLALNLTYESIPYKDSYITVPQLAVKRWSEKLGIKKRKRVGIAWSSTSEFANDQARSMTFTEFMRALPEGEFEYICLQKTIKPEDKKAFSSRSDIVFYGETLNSFTDTAALISNLDLVVSTCTSIPHLSAAIGKKTWLLLSFSPDFRWGLSGETTPWYPKMKLFRQQELWKWDLVLDNVKTELLKRRF